MKKKILSLIFALCLIIPCASLLTGCGPDDKADPTLYHLTLSANIELDDIQKAGLKAVYGYGEARSTIPDVLPEREESDVEDLKKAGATDADIEKAGKRQDDGSYYFFDNDKIYLVAPKDVAGYKFVNFYYKGTNTVACQSVYLNSDGKLDAWNMDNKDVALEAKYEKISYQINFNTLETGDINPNIIARYCPVDDGFVKTLKPATTTNPNKTFKCWAYQDTANANGGVAEWISLEESDGNFLLPTDYAEETIRLEAVWENKKFKISFAFEYDSGEPTMQSKTYEDVINSMSINANLTTVNDIAIESGVNTSVTKDSVIKIDGVSGWLEIFYTLKPEYRLFYFKLNGVRNGTIDSSEMTPPYISIHANDITEDSVITFVLAANIPE